MIKFYNNDIVYNFFHIPKTAGTSVSSAIKENFDYEFMWKKYKPDYPTGAQHLSYEFYKDYVQPTDINFAVVRNPVDRISSLYNNFIINDTRHYNSFTEWFDIMSNTYPHILESQQTIIGTGDIRLFNYTELHWLEIFLGVKLPKLNVLRKAALLTSNEVRFLKNHYQEDYQLLEYKVL